MCRMAFALGCSTWSGCVSQVELSFQKLSHRNVYWDTLVAKQSKHSARISLCRPTQIAEYRPIVPAVQGQIPTAKATSKRWRREGGEVRELAGRNQLERRCERTTRERCRGATRDTSIPLKIKDHNASKLNVLWESGGCSSSLGMLLPQAFASSA